MDVENSQQTVVVTGATSGIGLEVAKQLARLGKHVIGVGRSAERCQQAQKELLKAYPEASVAYLVADLALQSQVIRLAEDIHAWIASTHSVTLGGLVNNAAVFTYYLTLTAEGFEMQWAVNHLAPFLLTHALLPLLQDAPSARVVTVSSASHYRTRLNWEDIQLRRRYNCLRAYQQTKLANVLFTAELNRRLGPQSHIRAFAADPGLVKTDIGLKANPGLARWIWKWRSAGGVAPEEAARGLVYLVCEPSIQDSKEVYWKDCAPRPPSPVALDREEAQRIWALSEKMCGIKWSVTDA